MLYEEISRLDETEGVQIWRYSRCRVALIKNLPLKQSAKVNKNVVEIKKNNQAVILNYGGMLYIYIINNSIIKHT